MQLENNTIGLASEAFRLKLWAKCACYFCHLLSSFNSALCEGFFAPEVISQYSKEIKIKSKWGVRENFCLQLRGGTVVWRKKYICGFFIFFQSVEWQQEILIPILSFAFKKRNMCWQYFENPAVVVMRFFPPVNFLTGNEKSELTISTGGFAFT